MKTASPKKNELGLEEAPLQEKVVVPSKMTAAVLYGSEDLRIEQIDVPALAVDEVLLRGRLALTDGTDLKVWKRGYNASMVQPPAGCGHEEVAARVADGMRAGGGVRVIAVVGGEGGLGVGGKVGGVAAINVTETGDVAAAVRALTDESRGPDSVVEAAGNPATWEQALAMVRRGGVVNFFSGLPTGTHVEIEPAAIHYSEIKIISPFHHTPRFIREALEAIRRGEISAHDFVTEDIRLEDLPHAFERMKTRSGEIKLAVRP